MTVDGATSGSDVRWLLRARDLTKSFGPTQAVRGASLELASGEVHVLAGENGSGKSTLVKILSGVQLADSGSVSWRTTHGGEAIDIAPKTPAAAQRLGLATVFQEVKVAESSSILDNVWLGSEGLIRAPLRAGEKDRLARALFEELLGSCPPLGRPAGDLSLSDRQALSIVRALLRRPSILILDEATSSLDFETRDRLFALLRRLTGDGAGVVFISHRVDEMTEIGDRVTVMRSGLTVGTLRRGDWSTSDLVAMMSGEDPAEHPTARSSTVTRDPDRPPVVATREVVLAAGRRPISIEVRPGEIVGVAGLEGHGQAEFLEALRGVRPAGGEVVRLDDGHALPVRSTSQAASLGIAYVPRERRRSLFTWMSIRENFGMPTLSGDTSGPWLRPARTRSRLSRYVQELGIAARDLEDRITTLSGGNQQKVIVARWLAAQPRVLVLNDPTRGIDLRTKQEFYALLASLAADGIAVVMASSDLDEHLQLMDRVLVFREHELFRELDARGLTRRALVGAFFDHSVVVAT